MNAEAILTEMEKANKVFLANYEEIKEKYPGQYIAIAKEGRIVANNKNVDILFKELEKKKIGYERVLIEYILPKGKFLVL